MLLSKKNKRKMVAKGTLLLLSNASAYVNNKVGARNIFKEVKVTTTHKMSLGEAWDMLYAQYLREVSVVDGKPEKYTSVNINQLNGKKIYFFGERNKKEEKKVVKIKT